MTLDVLSNNIDFSPLHDRMQWYVDQEILPFCSTLVMRGLDVLDYKCFGYVDVDRKHRLRSDAIYRMFSNSKIVTSVAAMILYDEGRLGLDDPLSDYIPDFSQPQVLIKGATRIDQTEPLQTDITIRHLLSHSAGFSYGFIEPESLIDQAYLSDGLNMLRKYPGTLKTLMTHLSKFPLVYQPGSDWRYSIATDVVSRVIEIVSGQSLDVFFSERIFQPLNMKDTGFFIPSSEKDRLAALYIPEDMMNPMIPGFQLYKNQEDSQTHQAPICLSGGGGLYSTVADYVNFMRLFINNGTWNNAKILRPGTVDLMRRNHLADGIRMNFPMWDMKDSVFGLGFALKYSSALHEDKNLQEYHWGGMAGTHSWMSPQGVSGLCMTQLMPGFWHPFSHDFKEISYKITT
ncbi:MAG: penicillin-binding protein [Alphaproteobacteria bacterium]|nr:MAG: penicillin-binding protein [Alphaproteobacteria bacterium]